MLQLLLNPLYCLLGVLILSCIFIIFWDWIGSGVSGIPCSNSHSQEELDLAEVRAFFEQPQVRDLLKAHKSYIGKVTKDMEDGGIVVILAVVDTENNAPVQTQCYKVKKLAHDLRQNFGNSNMIVMA